MAEKKEDVIDVGALARKVFSRKKVFYITWPITFVVASLLIICVPRYYRTSSTLAPETSNAMSSAGALSSIVSSFGVDLSAMQSTDAISPLLYPDLMEDNGFVASLLSIRVRNCNGDLETTYYDYLDKHQEEAWWSTVGKAIKKLMPKPKRVEVKGDAASKRDPYMMTEREDRILRQARKTIILTVDKQTGVISISTEAQDPLICKMLADSVTVKLQRFITDYRTNKARIDLEYYRGLVDEAKKNYDKARQDYSTYSDANSDMVLQVYKSRLDDLENDMQLKYNTYSTLNAQMQAAIAKVQERTPAFTTLKGAELPLKPAGPKRMLFVIGMLFLVSLADIVYILWADIKLFFSKP